MRFETYGSRPGDADTVLYTDFFTANIEEIIVEIPEENEQN